MKKILTVLFCLAVLAGAFLFFSQMKTAPAVDANPASHAGDNFSVTPATQKISHKDSSSTVDLEYPELSFSGVSAPIAQKINDAIAADTLAYEKDFFTQVQDFAADIAALPPEAPRESEAFRRYQVFLSSKFGTVSILYSDEQMFPGYAHPVNYFDSAIYDVRTGSLITLDTLFQAGKEGELFNRFIAALTKKYSLTDDTYNLTADRLPPFSHFVVEDSGLHLYTDQDSILAHVDGSADVLIPWTSLQDIISARFKK